ncbi:MAG: hypothetical protein DRZ80_05920 [Thermoprotei archaeon]|nr:MAG: hypothetical protein DRZ80_05920 [Thermoprotei archaeon]
MRFVDSTIFIKWVSASKKRLKIDEAISGYVLHKISRGEAALTTTLVKDKVLIWLSRYKASRLTRFLEAFKSLISLKLVAPTLEHEEKAAEMYGRYSLGISDLINLAVMKSYGITEIYSSDKGFDQIPWVKRIFENLTEESEFKEFLDTLKLKGIKISELY